MIELNNVTKIYKAKKGPSTTALEEVSLNIASHGLTFIVGASGSGKSTLLNVIGGLDSITSGSIHIDGEDITNIKEEKMDAYRNTYVGFVFQDYNILDQYNVYDNVKLSLSLQERNEDELVSKILEDLGLKDLEKRKINELSGGQKQRVAIARALVKNPRIILADEPTGNLDSNTSIQIMEILKNISKERQVIVVSHDLNLAKDYGDRIIEIEDGRIISDTFNIDIKENLEKLDYKKSKLPFKEVIRLGLTNIRTKLSRFILVTILVSFALLFVSFTFNMMMFNPYSHFVDVMKGQDEHYFNISSQQCKRYEDDDFICNLIIANQKDVDEVSKRLDMVVNPIYSFYNYDEPINFIYGEHDEQNSFLAKYYSTEPTNVVELENEDLIGEIKGRLPKKGDELVISQAKAETFMRYGVKLSSGEFYKPESIDELITSNKKILFGENEVIIVGVTINDYKVYDLLKKYGNFDSKEAEDYAQYYNIPNEYIYAKGFKDIAIHNYKENDIYENLYFSKSPYISSTNPKPLDEKIRYVGKDGIVETDNIKQDEIIISLNNFKISVGDFDAKLNEFRQGYMDIDYEKSLEMFIQDYANKKRLFDDYYLDVILLRDTYQMKEDNLKVKIAGISLDDNSYVSPDFTNLLSRVAYTLSGVRFYEEDYSNIRSIIDKFEIRDMKSDEGDSLVANMRFISVTRNMINIYETLRKYIIAITIVFVFFATILIYNFLKTTIINSKKYIGILRALGTSSKDLIKIFFIETFMISIVSWILSIIGWYVSSELFNSFLNMDVKLLKINYIILEPIVIPVILVFIVVLSNLILMTLIKKISNIRPIDTILNKR